MRLVLLFVLTTVLAAGQAGPGAGNRACVTSYPAVEFKGTVTKAHTGPGVAFLEVLRGKDTWHVQLGPMRYLIAEDFNPKAGDAVTVKGYGQDGFAVASEVRLEAEKRTLKFRDAQGRPLWRGGQNRR